MRHELEAAREEAIEAMVLTEQLNEVSTGVFPRPQSVWDFPAGAFETNRRRH